MPLSTYIDIEFADFSGELSGSIIANQVMPVLHGAFKKLGGVYALALPNCIPGKKMGIGDKLRVFSVQAHDLRELTLAIKDHYVIRDYCSISAPKPVPNDFCGPWIEYRRYRLSNKNAERKQDFQTEPLRNRRMRCAEEQRLPYFVLRSASTNRGFSLVVEPLSATGGNQSQIAPDSYGLSVSSRPFYVPQIP